MPCLFLSACLSATNLYVFTRNVAAGSDVSALSVSVCPSVCQQSVRLYQKCRCWIRWKSPVCFCLPVCLPPICLLLSGRRPFVLCIVHLLPCLRLGLLPERLLVVFIGRLVIWFTGRFVVDQWGGCVNCASVCKVLKTNDLESVDQ